MEFHAEPCTFKTLLTKNKKYTVPRYQRTFSWGKREISEMYNDIFGRLVVKENKLANTEYFFGNILLQGDMIGSTQKVYVIDGQQRLTAVSIFLSTLAKMFSDEKQNDLKEGVWKYVVKKDDNGEQMAIFQNETPAPFFQYSIQMNDIECSPTTDEEFNIDFAHKYFLKKLSKKYLVKEVHDKFGLINYDYIEILKALRDQLLNSYIILSWTINEDYANLIFEIMNAKGKELATIDLIKNSIFDFVSETDPTDFASNTWKEITKNLNEDSLRISFPTFFRHYWCSRFGKISDSKLWDSYKRTIKTKEKCEELLIDLQKFSKIYIKCLSPNLVRDFENKKQYADIVQILTNLNRTFGLEMPRVYLINLYDKFLNGIITAKQFRLTLKFLERFHFIYNGVCSERTNRLDTIYCDCSVKLRNCEDQESCVLEIRNLIAKLKEKLPSLEVYKNSIKLLKYYDEKNYAFNICRYYLQEIYMMAAKTNYVPLDFSIEHIFNKNKEDENSLILPHLMPLESSLNQSTGSKEIIDKINDYKKSTYKIVEIYRIALQKCSNKEEAMEKCNLIFEQYSQCIYSITENFSL